MERSNEAQIVHRFGFDLELGGERRGGRRQPCASRDLNLNMQYRKDKCYDMSHVLSLTHYFYGANKRKTLEQAVLQ